MRRATTIPRRRSICRRHRGAAMWRRCSMATPAVASSLRVPAPPVHSAAGRRSAPEHRLARLVWKRAGRSKDDSAHEQQAQGTQRRADDQPAMRSSLDSERLQLRPPALYRPWEPGLPGRLSRTPWSLLLLQYGGRLRPHPAWEASGACDGTRGAGSLATLQQGGLWARQWRGESTGRRDHQGCASIRKVARDIAQDLVAGQTQLTGTALPSSPAATCRRRRTRCAVPRSCSGPVSTMWPPAAPPVRPTRLCGRPPRG
jgi:hypothetical protein